jgi:hypothetical protein
MKKYQFIIEVKDTYTPFDYGYGGNAFTITKRKKTVTAKNYKEAKEKIEIYLGAFGVYRPNYKLKLVNLK